MPVTFPLSDAEIRERLASSSRDLTPGTQEALRQLFGAVFEDAPEDGTTYGREDGEWVVVTGGGLPEAPIDGQIYGRKDAGWTAVPAGSVNTQIVPLNFAFDRFKASNGATVTWADSANPPVFSIITPTGMDPDELMLYDFKVSVSNIVDGVSFTVTAHTHTGYEGSLDIMCIGI